MKASHSLCILTLGISSYLAVSAGAVAQAENGRARFQDRALREAINQRYHSLRLAKVELRDAPLDSAVEYLHAKAMAVARGVSVPNFVVIVPQGVESRNVDIRLNDIPLFEALAYICDQTGTEFSFEPNAVVVCAKGAPLPRSNLADLALLCPWLTAINLAKIDIRSMSMNDALEYLAEKARKATSDERTINLVLPPDTDNNASKIINLRADNMPFAEAFRYVCLLGGADFVVEPHALIVASAGKPLPTGDPEESRSGRSPLWKVVVPKFSVQQVSVTDAFACLKHLTEKVSPMTPNFVIQASLTSTPQEMTLNLEEMPFFEAVRYLCYLSDSRYTVEKYAINIVPQPKPEPPKEEPKADDTQ